MSLYLIIRIHWILSNKCNGFYATSYYQKTVAARITDDKENMRTFYLPDAYANKYRDNFEDPATFRTYQMK